MDLVEVLRFPFEFLDTILPTLLLLLSILILTRNFALTTFFKECGVNLAGQTTCGVAIGLSGIVLITGLSSCHATTALIFMFAFLAILALRQGSGRIAMTNASTSAVLVPVVLVS